MSPTFFVHFSAIDSWDLASGSTNNGAGVVAVLDGKSQDTRCLGDSQPGGLGCAL
jgi:hypothetical protein